MPFTIPNDPTAAVGAAVYSAQSQLDQQDIKSLVAAFQGTGFGSPLGAAPLVGSQATIDPASGGVNVNTLIGTQTITAAAALAPQTYYATTGTIYVPTSTGIATVTYNGVTATQFQNCTTTAGSGTMTNGGTITSLQSAFGSIASTFIQGQSYISTVTAPPGNAVVSAFIDHSPADTTYGRIDLVGMDATGVVVKIAGTAAANPCEPTITVDVNGMPTVAIAYSVYIPPAATNLTANNLTDKRIILRPEIGYWSAADAGLTMGANRQRYVVFPTVTANRIVTLPACNAVNAGYTVTIADQSGSCTGPVAGGGTAKMIQIKANATIPDTVNNVASATNFEEIRDPYGSVTLRSDGVSNWDIVSVTPTIRTEVYTSSSGAGGYRKPLGAKAIHIILIGGGGAGGSGQKQLINNVTAGGGAGQAGGYTEAWLNPADLAATETATVGAAGAAGGTTAATSAGANGGNGGDSKFTINGTVALYAQGGVGGTGGSAGTGGPGGTGNLNSGLAGTAGGAGGSGTGPVAAVAGTASGNQYVLLPTGGGGGGGATGANAAVAAAAGGTGPPGTGTTGAAIAGGTAGSTNTNNVGAGVSITATGASWFGGGTGGGGGGPRTSAGNGNVGGAGGAYGGGGGGGGNGMGANNTNNNGNGGAGGAGVVVIITTR